MLESFNMKKTILLLSILIMGMGSIAYACDDNRDCSEGYYCDQDYGMCVEVPQDEDDDDWW